MEKRLLIVFLFLITILSFKTNDNIENNEKDANLESLTNVEVVECVEPIVDEQVVKEKNKVEKTNKSKKKKKEKVVISNNPLVHKPEYCQMPKKSLKDNYLLIEENLNLTFHILYGGVPDTNTKEFLIEIAMVESMLGYLTKRYSVGGTKGKGVWQIDRCAFDATKNIKGYPQLIPYLDRIKNETGIDWIKDVKWEHCNYIFYGAITAQLYLIIKGIDAETETKLRAKQWKIHYNTYLGKGRTQDYIKKVSQMNNLIFKEEVIEVEADKDNDSLNTELNGLNN